jgi:hypothetical protein
MVSHRSAAVLFAAAAFGAAALDGAPVRAQAPAPVVVELYTSQGCNSCPPADAFMGELAKRPGVIALSFHVTYWNYLGWADPYSIREADIRQAGYQMALRRPNYYTPQTVVAGRWETVGSSRRDVDALIAKAAKNPATVAVTVERAGDRLRIVADAAPAAKGADVFLVLFDRQHTTRIERGENGGKTLTYFNVVREIRAVGRHEGARVELSLAAAKRDGGAAVLVQAPNKGPILGAALVRLD